jgi:hypothetical protein
MSSDLIEVTGVEMRASGGGPLDALIDFYEAFNAGNLNALAAKNCAERATPNTGNPIGGIRRGWVAIREGYSKLSNGAATVQVAFHDFTSQCGDDWQLFVRRERGICRTCRDSTIGSGSSGWFHRRTSSCRTDDGGHDAVCATHRPGSSSNFASQSRTASWLASIPRRGMISLRSRRVSPCSQCGSGAISVLGRLMKRHHPGTKQIDAGSAVHNPLEVFQSIDLSLRLPISSRFRHSIANRADILPQRPRGAPHSNDAALAHIALPGGQLLNRPATKQAAEPHRQLAHRGDCRGGCLEQVDVDDLPVCHLAAWLDAERRRGQWRDLAPGVTL